MNQRRIAVLGLLLALGLFHAPPAAAGDRTSLLVSAASSLTEVLRDVETAFEREHPRVDVRLNLAGSGILAAQVRYGARVDVFVSAGTREIEALGEAGFLEPSTILEVASNRLVLIVREEHGLAGLPLENQGSSDAPGALDALAETGSGRLAIGNPKTVPAGLYAETALRRRGVWERIHDRLVLAENVRQVLRYVESGAAEAGLVYETDLQTSTGLTVAEHLDPEDSGPIRYLVARVRGSEAGEEADAFLRFLGSAAGQQIFAEAGFLPLVQKATE